MMKMKIEFEPLGIIRRLDDLGRIVLPKEFRAKVGIEVGEAFEILSDKKGNFYIKRVKERGQGEDDFKGDSPGVIA